MITAVAQRWRERRGVYVPAEGTARVGQYDIVQVPNDRDVKAFVVRHHYSATYPAALARFEFRHRVRGLVGVAVYSLPFPNTAAAAGVPLSQTYELSRLVLLDSEPGNAESLCVAEAHRQLRVQGVSHVLSFADPEPRRTSSGELIHPGHLGGVYQALNASYTGRSTARSLHVLPDGTVFSARAASKVRARERGWRYAVDQLIKAGAEEPTDDDLRAWLREQLTRVARVQRHHGCHRYVWCLTGKAPKSLPYPKWES